MTTEVSGVSLIEPHYYPDELTASVESAVFGYGVIFFSPMSRQFGLVWWEEDNKCNIPLSWSECMERHTRVIHPQTIYCEVPQSQVA